MARPRRLPGSSEVRVGCPPLGRAERTFWVRLRPYGWISSFFTAIFCSTQLASSTAVPGMPWNAPVYLIKQPNFYGTPILTETSPM